MGTGRGEEGEGEMHGGDNMEMNTQDYLKKALLDTQEKVRDCQPAGFTFLDH